MTGVWDVALLFVMLSRISKLRGILEMIAKEFGMANFNFFVFIGNGLLEGKKERGKKGEEGEKRRGLSTTTPSNDEHGRKKLAFSCPKAEISERWYPLDS